MGAAILASRDTLTGVSCAALAALALASGAVADDGLTVPAIDPGVYREGAIQRSSGQVGAWSWVCDEVPKLHNRFCSLRTAVADGEGHTIAALTVSTGDDGRPAALLTLPSSFVLGRAVVIDVTNAGSAAAKRAKGKPTAPTEVRVAPAACSTSECRLVWTLPPAQVAALNGGGIVVRIGPAWAAGFSSTDAGVLTIPIAADGFSAAVAAGLKPSQ